MEARQPPSSVEPEPAAPPAAETTLDAERNGLHIQAAAVAAQQAQLTEQESRLNQLGVVRELRERQIAVYLAKRQRRLLALRERIKQERTDWEQKKAAQQSELERACKQAERARRRFVEARKRFKQRWLHYTAEKQTSLHQREQELTAAGERLQAGVGAYQRDRARFDETRLRLNGELELDRRRNKEAWQELVLAQQRWEETLNLEHRERDRRLRALEAREAAVADGQGKLAAETRSWLDRRARLLKEIEGLDTRVRNLRHQLHDLHGPARPAAVVGVAAALSSKAPAPAAGPTTAHDLPDVPAVVRRLANHLADQRWLLLEHWSRFLEIEMAWQHERAMLLAGSESTQRVLRERESQLDRREGSLEAHEAELRRRQELLTRTRAELDAWQSRLTLCQAEWENERAGLVASVQAREETATALILQLEAVRQRRQARRRQEVEELRQARAQCEAVRTEYSALLCGLQESQVALGQEQRALAARALAVERSRLELVNQAPDAAAAEKRLERLRRRHAARIEEAERTVTAQRRWLLAESRRLEDRARQLQKREDDLRATREALSEQQAAREQDQIAHTREELPRERELRLLRSRHENDARQLAALRDEVERVARLFLDEPTPPAVSQAA
jgi:hypothetical protein